MDPILKRTMELSEENRDVERVEEIETVAKEPETSLPPVVEESITDHVYRAIGVFDANLALMYRVQCDADRRIAAMERTCNTVLVLTFVSLIAVLSVRRLVINSDF